MKALRRPSLAAVAMMAIGMSVGVGNAAASSGFLADTYPVTQTGQEAGTEHTIGTNEGPLNCAAPAFTAEASGPSESLSPTSVSSPACTLFKYNMTLKMNGCKLIFHPGAKTGSTYEGTFDIGPSGCGPITTQMPIFCTISIGSQTGLKATFENTGSGSGAAVKATANASGLVYALSGPGCSSKNTFANGTWNGSWQISGSTYGKATGLRVGDLRVSFSESGGEFEAGEYPAAILADQDADDPLSFGANGGSLECADFQLGRGMTGASVALPLSQVAIGGCAGFGFGSIPVNMNSCQFVLGADGDFDVVCAGTDKIELRRAGCWTTIGAQSGRTGVSLTNVGEGSSQSVVAELDVEGLAYSEIPKGPFSTCWPAEGGSYGNGSLSGTLTLEGHNGGYIG